MSFSSLAFTWLSLPQDSLFPTLHSLLIAAPCEDTCQRFSFGSAPQIANATAAHRTVITSSGHIVEVPCLKYG